MSDLEFLTVRPVLKWKGTVKQALVSKWFLVAWCLHSCLWYVKQVEKNYDPHCVGNLVCMCLSEKLKCRWKRVQWSHMWMHLCKDGLVCWERRQFKVSICVWCVHKKDGFVWERKGPTVGIIVDVNISIISQIRRAAASFEEDSVIVFLRELDVKRIARIHHGAVWRDPVDTEHVVRLHTCERNHVKHFDLISPFPIAIAYFQAARRATFLTSYSIPSAHENFFPSASRARIVRCSMSVGV